MSKYTKRTLCGPCGIFHTLTLNSSKQFSNVPDSDIIRKLTINKDTGNVKSMVSKRSYNTFVSNLRSSLTSESALVSFIRKCSLFRRGYCEGEPNKDALNSYEH